MAQQKPKKKPGPEEERLAIEGGWESAVSRALAKGKPPKRRPAKKAAKKKRRS